MIKQMTILIEKDVHKKYKAHALELEISLTAWIKKALANQLKADKK